MCVWVCVCVCVCVCSLGNVKWIWGRHVNSTGGFKCVMKSDILTGDWQGTKVTRRNSEPKSWWNMNLDVGNNYAFDMQTFWLLIHPGDLDHIASAAVWRFAVGPLQAHMFMTASWSCPKIETQSKASHNKFSLPEIFLIKKTRRDWENHLKIVRNRFFGNFEAIKM